MPAPVRTAVIVIGIDIARTHFSSLGLITEARSRCDKVVVKPGRGSTCQFATVPRWHGGLRPRTPFGRDNAPCALSCLAS
jgi:hypothetical protein